MGSGRRPRKPVAWQRGEAARTAAQAGELGRVDGGMSGRAPRTTTWCGSAAEQAAARRNGTADAEGCRGRPYSKKHNHAVLGPAAHPMGEHDTLRLIIVSKQVVPWWIRAESCRVARLAIYSYDVRREYLSNLS